MIKLKKLSIMAKMTILSVITFVILCCLSNLFANSEVSAKATEFTVEYTDEYRSFLAVRSAENTDNSEIWRSKDEETTPRIMSMTTSVITSVIKSLTTSITSAMETSTASADKEGSQSVSIQIEQNEVPAAPAENKEQNATLAVVGDLMCHAAQLKDALSKGGNIQYDFSHTFKHVSRYITDADYAIGNLETTMVLPGNKPSGYPSFGSPISFAEAVKNAGFDFVATANNHSLDFGKKGVIHTLEVLDDLGLAHTGTYAAEEDSQEIAVIDVNGITFALVSYTYGVNGNPIPKDMPWCVNMIKKAKSDIAQAKELNPDVIIVMPHIGNEYETTTRQRFKNEVYELLEAGADIVLAAHPHVLQPAEFVKITEADGTERNCFVAYSMGNFVSSQRTAPRDFGMVVNLHFKKADGEKATLNSVDLMPVWVKFTSPKGSYDITVLPVNELDKPEFSAVISELRPNDVRRIEAVKLAFAKMFPGFSDSGTDSGAKS